MLAAVAEEICRHWSLRIIELTFPERLVPAPDNALDGIVQTDGPTLAVEHTMLQSFPNQIDHSFRFQPLQVLCETLSGHLPGPGRYELSVDPAQLEGHARADLGALGTWIEATAPILTPGRTSTPSNVATAGPPVLPFTVTLLRTEGFEGVPDGTLQLRWPIDFEQLASARLDQMASTLQAKLPKLEDQRPPNGRTILILENRDIQLVNAHVVTDSVRGALDRTGLQPPDAVVVAHYIGDTAGATWIKDRDRWHPELTDLHWRPLTLASPERPADRHTPPS